MTNIYTLPLASWEALLRQYRAQLIADGKIVAEHLCRVQGTTHSREIVAEMGRRNLLNPYVKGFWIGAVLRDPVFVCTGKIVLPPLEPGVKSHDPRLIYLWRLAEGGAAPLVLYEYHDYCGHSPAPTTAQKVNFILRHVTVTKTGKHWSGQSRWPADHYLRTIKQDLGPYRDWLKLFAVLQRLQEPSQAKARAEARRLVTEFVRKKEGI